MEQVKAFMDQAKIKDTWVEHLDETCEQCQRPLQDVHIIFDDGTEKVNRTGCICEATKQVNEKQREINANTFERGSLLYGNYKNKGFDDYDAKTETQAQALKLSRYYADHFADQLKNGQNIFFQGQPGTGKTHLAAAIRKSVRDQNYKVLFMSLPDYIDKLKQEFGESNKRHPISKMAKDADLLILDDVGANRMTEFEVSELFKLVDSRNGKCTIYTTNYTSDDFTKNIAIHRVFSRMMQNTKIVVIKGDDYRTGGMF